MGVSAPTRERIMKIIRDVVDQFSGRFDHDDAGVTSIEYGLVATAIALLVAAGVGGLAPKVLDLFAAIGS